MFTRLLMVYACFFFVILIMGMLGVETWKATVPLLAGYVIGVVHEISLSKE